MLRWAGVHFWVCNDHFSCLPPVFHGDHLSKERICSPKILSFKSRPHLEGPFQESNKEVKKIATICKKVEKLRCTHTFWMFTLLDYLNCCFSLAVVAVSDFICAVHVCNFFFSWYEIKGSAICQFFFSYIVDLIVPLVYWVIYLTK